MGHRPSHIYDPITDFNLPQGHAKIHHWRLKNLRIMLGIIAEAYKLSVINYLMDARLTTSQDLTFYALGICLAGNSWDILKAHRQELQPQPPPDLSFGSLHYEFGQDVPAVVSSFTRADGTLVLYFRGTATVRETLTDFSAISSSWIMLPAFGKAKFLKTFQKHYVNRDTKGRSLETFVHKCLLNAKSIIIVGHSLGGAMACLAAYQACASHKRVRLITIGGAQGGDAAFCAALHQNCDEVLNIVNTLDEVPWLALPFRATCQCYKMVVADSAPGRGLLSRALTHDPLYYAANLFRFGTSDAKPSSCQAEENTVKYVSFPPLKPMQA